jgi:tricorn protease
MTLQDSRAVITIGLMSRLAVFASLFVFLFPLAAEDNARPSFAEPSMAPDRPEVAFVSGGDIWTAPLAGGEAHLLVSNPATESRPMYSPDGTRLAFVSNRSGNDDIFVLDLKSGDLKRITYDDGADQLDAWSRDGKYLYFSSASHDISYMGDVYRVSAEGGTPMPVAADRYAAEYWAAPSPSGDTIAVTGKGITDEQWWRHGHSHLDDSELWLVRIGGAAPKYESFDAVDAKDMWPMWTPDGKRLYFVSDRSGAENIWVKDLAPGSRARQVTNFTDGRLLWPTVAYDGKTIVFERDFGIWKLDTANGKPSRLDIVLRGAPAGPSVTHLSATAEFSGLALSPDGRKIAFVSHGDVFAASSKRGGLADRVTHDPANEFQVAWMPGSKRVVYVSDRDGNYHLYQYDFVAGAETQLTHDSQGDDSPIWSPDGKLLAFVRGGRQLVIYDPATKQERMIATGYFDKPPVRGAPFSWSPDSKWLAYDTSGFRHFRDVYVVPAAGGAAKQISFVPDGFVRDIVWSPDGTYILYSTGQRTEPGQVARIDLIPRTPKFREDQFRDLFKNPPARPVAGERHGAPEAEAGEHTAAPKHPPVVKIDFDGIRERLTWLPIGLDVGTIRISPDGKTLLLSATSAGEPNLYTYSLDELAREPAVARQLTSTPGPKEDPQWSPDGKQVFYLGRSRVEVATVESRESKPLAVTAEMDVDFNRQKEEVFAEAWQYLDDHFVDPEFNGRNWKAIRARFAPQIAGARTPDEERRLLSLMIGELNSSHCGISAPRPGAGGRPGDPHVTGRIGVSFDRHEYETSGRLKVTEVVTLSPADIAGIKPGNYLLAVDGREIGAHTNFNELMEHTIDRRVVITVADSADGAGKHDAVLQPVSSTVAKKLIYRQWVEGRRAYVHKISNGRLGYVHMEDMSENSLKQFYMDLDTETQSREGVIIDVRNNTGGFVNAYALDVLARRPYLNLTPRGEPTAPARSVLGQRALERPTILVTNRHSLSDAEDFTQGYRALKLGKVVGDPTAGWIIYTGGTQLIDGSTLRLPGMRVTTEDGQNMELHPRPVDIRVERPLGESYTGTDIQLETAARELLREIGAAHGAQHVAAVAPAR